MRYDRFSIGDKHHQIRNSVAERAYTRVRLFLEQEYGHIPTFSDTADVLAVAFGVACARAESIGASAGAVQSVKELAELAYKAERARMLAPAQTDHQVLLPAPDALPPEAKDFVPWAVFSDDFKWKSQKTWTAQPRFWLGIFTVIWLGFCAAAIVTIGVIHDRF